jgi:hypothetical protein
MIRIAKAGYIIVLIVAKNTLNILGIASSLRSPQNNNPPIEIGGNN